MREVLKAVNPDITAHPDSHIRPWKLKQSVRNLPKTLKESGVKMRGLKKSDDVLRREIRRDIDKIETTGMENKMEGKTDKPQRKESAADYLEKIRRPEDKAEPKKETALTSGSAMARQEAKPPAEARAERQSIKPMHVELAPGIEKIESVSRGEGEPIAPDIG